ncbi:hypothetical protein [Massilia sp. CF038]|uniref:hypothetical protein n=1 Tax=Massilia sp. CF038 TaxID=1881045 RepID=UPI0011610D7A|nr:hypothetical protein [Massilia sp. CF038]
MTNQPASAGCFISGWSRGHGGKDRNCVCDLLIRYTPAWRVASKGSRQPVVLMDKKRCTKKKFHELCDNFAPVAVSLTAQRSQ